MARTAESAELDLVEALAKLRIPVIATRSGDPGADLVLPDGTLVEVKAFASVRPDTAERLIQGGTRPGVVGVVVADQITPAARELLSDKGWGWLDRRGRLALTAGPLQVDVPIAPLIETEGAPATPTVGTEVGLDVAVALLVDPGRRRTVRNLVEFTGRSLGAVHRAMRGLADEGLVGRDGLPLARELFWEAVARWSPTRVAIAEIPKAGDAGRTEQLQLGLDDIDGAVGWALTGAMAANVFGAPMPIRGDDAIDFYVPSSRIIRVAKAFYGEPISPIQRGATVALPPVRWACERRFDAASLGREHPWLHFAFVHPVIAALDLAADPGRGREILTNWTPPEPFVRVW